MCLQQRPVLTATPRLTAIEGCHSGKTAADDTDILFFLLSYHPAPCTPFSACLLGGLALSIISSLQNLQSLLPHWYLPSPCLQTCINLSYLKEKESRPDPVAPSNCRLSFSLLSLQTLHSCHHHSRSTPCNLAPLCRAVALPPQIPLPLPPAPLPHTHTHTPLVHADQMNADGILASWAQERNYGEREGLSLNWHC